MQFYKIAFVLLLATPAVALPKILCLHGGGGTGPGFRGELRDLMDALSDRYEFHFPSAPTNNLWVQDPPGGKGEPTTDPNFAADSVGFLNDYVQQHGPFHGILGYSQGSMFTTYYLSVAPANSFELAVMFCGYLPTTHLGLLDSIRQQSPFDDIPSLVFMGQRDSIITNPMTREQAGEFTSPVVIRSSQAGHHPPSRSDSTFNNVVSFMIANAPGGSGGSGSGSSSSGGSNAGAGGGDKPDTSSGDKPDASYGDKPDASDGDKPDASDGDKPAADSLERGCGRLKKKNKCKKDKACKWSNKKKKCQVFDCPAQRKQRKCEKGLYCEWTEGWGCYWLKD